MATGAAGESSVFILAVVQQLASVGRFGLRIFALYTRGPLDQAAHWADAEETEGDFGAYQGLKELPPEEPTGMALFIE